MFITAGPMVKLGPVRNPVLFRVRLFASFGKILVHRSVCLLLQDLFSGPTDAEFYLRSYALEFLATP